MTTNYTVRVEFCTAAIENYYDGGILWTVFKYPDDIIFQVDEGSYIMGIICIAFVAILGDKIGGSIWL